MRLLIRSGVLYNSIRGVVPMLVFLWDNFLLKNCAYLFLFYW